MEPYDHKKIEKKWQTKWEKDSIYTTPDISDKEKCYILDMFPYPSGDGLHVGHPKGYIATDVYSRFKKMQGREILHPMGWDAFGLPAENYAIANKIHPRVAVEKNIARFKEQLTNIGLNYDWSREINTTDPAYYKWTQWIFLKLFEKGLAYESHEPINWCPSCQTGLANEDLEGGKCERCGSPVEKRPMRQWVLKITDYADRLLADLEGLDWSEFIKESQRNWIGRSEGAEISFKVKGESSEGGTEISVFTTRPDTLFGATYIVLAPEHPFLTEEIQNPKPKIQNKEEVGEYIQKARTKEDIERTAEGKDKTGVKLEGIVAINPANKEEVPVFIADYVLPHYGTGAIMAVPAHDRRDFEFAKKFNIPVTKVVEGNPVPFVGTGTLCNSGEFTGMSNEEAKKKITEFVGGKLTTTYKLRDWVFSRQRYWGEPIPIIHCRTCWENPKSKIQNPKEGVDYVVIDGKEHAIVPVPESDLPVVLPEVDHYEPTGTGESPLANIPEWVNTTCPSCGGPAKRETNTMPQWAGSSWYYLRYIDPANATALVDKKKEKYWSPVDLYVGGAEHATRHLIYARFWHKFLYDIGVVNYTEPFSRLISVGLILAEDGRKMSKRFGNVINPDDIIERFGADSLRVYEMFMGPFGNTIAWLTDGLVGARRLIERVVKMQSKVMSHESSVTDPHPESRISELDIVMHQTIKKVTEDIELFKFNTAISALMICMNAFEKHSAIPRSAFETLLKLIAPFAPHIAEELWHTLGHTTSIHLDAWPVYDESKIESETVTIAVQVNGKLRGSITCPQKTEEATILALARADEKVEKWLNGKDIIKIVYVPGKVMNLVVTDA